MQMHNATPNHASDNADRRDRRPSPVRDRLDDIDYDLDYELELDDFEPPDPGE
jgi:hypothetical protein